MAARIVAAWPGFTVKDLAYMSDGAERVVVLTEFSGRGLEMPMLELWTVQGGKIKQCQPFYFDTAAATHGAAAQPL
jgi:ketosteroid isomerase-like protein